MWLFITSLAQRLRLYRGGYGHPYQVRRFHDGLAKVATRGQDFFAIIGQRLVRKRLAGCS